MILIVIASLFLPQVLSANVRILGGMRSHIQAHPWLVSIQKNDRHRCCGSIISENIILTAAHCAISGPIYGLIVRVGSSRTDSGGSWHKVVAIKSHENYEERAGTVKILNDLALMKVSPPFKFDKNVTKIRLAERGNVVTPGTVVTVAGWGALYHGGKSNVDLRSTNLTVIDNERCARLYGDVTGTQMTLNNLICAAQNGHDSCNGDSGGPLIAEGIQVGIVSWGIGCDDPRYSGVYIDVARYRDWIEENFRMLILKSEGTMYEPSDLFRSFFQTFAEMNGPLIF